MFKLVIIIQSLTWIFSFIDFVEGEDPDQEYIDKALPILEERLMFGGARLAALMVYIYGETAMQAATFLN